MTSKRLLHYLAIGGLSVFFLFIVLPKHARAETVNTGNSGSTVAMCCDLQMYHVQVFGFVQPTDPDVPGYYEIYLCIEDGSGSPVRCHTSRFTTTGAGELVDSWDIPMTDYAKYNWASGQFNSPDGSASGSITNISASGRRVEVISLNAPGTVNVGDTFNIDWHVEWDTEDAIINYDSSLLSCTVPNGGSLKAYTGGYDLGSMSCTALASGNANLTVTATGPAYPSGPVPDSKSTTVSIGGTGPTPPPPGPGPTPPGPTPPGPTPPGPAPIPPPPPNCSDNASVTHIADTPTDMIPGNTYSFTVKVNNIGSTDWTYGEGDGWQFRQLSGNTIKTTNVSPYNAVVVNPPYDGYGHLPTYIGPGQENSNVTWTFNIVAPASSGTFTMQMHYGGNPVTGCPIGYFGQQFIMNLSVAAGKITVNSHDNTGAPLASTWTIDGPQRIVQGSPATTQTYSLSALYNGNYTLTPDNLPGYNPPTFLPNNGLTVQNGNSVSWDIYYTPIVAPPPTPNLSLSTKEIYQVNGADYTSSTIIKTGDTVTFRIFIRNSGNGAGTLAGINDVYTNLGSISNIKLNGSSVGSFAAITGSIPALTIWTVTFDAVPTAASGVFSNYAIINCNPSCSTTTNTIRYLLSNKPGAPQFQEVAP